MVTSLDRLKESLRKDYDVFISSASFEKRSLSVYQAIYEDVKIAYKLVSVSEHNKDLTKDTLDFFLNHEFELFEISNTNQITTVLNFSNVLSPVLENKTDASFLIDITTFTRQTLLILMRLLRNVLTETNEITFLYVPALEYSPGFSDENKWLTRGILQVDSVFGYSGIIRPSRPYHLIILLGFEVERAISMIASYEPSKITVGFANEKSSNPKHYTINRQRFDKLLAEYPNAEPFEFTCDDVSICKSEILDLVNSQRGYNVVVSPMNNKISTAASALAAFENKEIQIAIAIPAIYNINYSVGASECHILDFPGFFRTTQLRY